MRIKKEREDNAVEIHIKNFSFMKSCVFLCCRINICLFDSLSFSAVSLLLKVSTAPSIMLVNMAGAGTPIMEPILPEQQGPMNLAEGG